MEIQNGNNREHTDIRHLYIHIPFCPKVCPYCSFYKETSDRNKTQTFLDAVLLDMDWRIVDLGICRPETIYFGGGTPSALSVKQLEFLLGGLRDRLDLSNLRESTFEMNPATISLEKAQMLRMFGINRISMGVQSWNLEILKKLGRVHSAEQAERSFQILREAGFDNLNLDFIFGVPGQSAEIWEETLRKTVSLDPEHISAYCLTYEEDTEYFRRFQSGELIQDNAQDAAFFESSMSILNGVGYHQYEISNYAKPGYECLHNLGYWFGHDYLGLGPSAFSTVGERRWQNVADTNQYINQIRRDGKPASFSELVTSSMRKAESTAFGLRTSTGVPESEMERWNIELELLRREGYIETVDHHIRLTDKGRMVADSIAELFV
jgi:oxygen-independent coproporphyrinogen-3 oxidase